MNDNAPVFVTENVFSLLENSPPVIIGTVEAIDVDPVNVSLHYSITSEVNGFLIDAQSGQLRSTRLFDREIQIVYELMVQVVDSGFPPLTSSTIVTVEIADENESPPLFSEDTPSNISVSESVDVSSVILTLTASDNDNSRVVFRLVSGSEVFSLQSSEGDNSGGYNQSVELVLSQALDYEQVTEYTIVVEVFDILDSSEGVSLSSTTEITVRVIDDNDNPPLFSADVISAAIPELAAVGTLVRQVTANDADSGANAVIYYDIVNSESPFTITRDTGIITVARSEDLTIELVGPQYTLQVVASDRNFTTTVDVVIELLDINNNVPFFTSNTSFTIAEDFTPVGTPAEGSSGGVELPPLASGASSGESVRQILTITASDLDEGINAELRFSLVTESDLFFIDAESGELFVTGTLDRETQDTYIIEVRVTDRGTPSLENTTSILIIVADINDNAPQFVEESYSDLVLENQPIGIEVVYLQAVDMDVGENANVVFSILDENIVPFQVDPQLGIIQTAEQFDREGQSSYSFQVEARSGDLSSTVSVFITVEGENEFPPTISPNQVTTTILEGVYNNTLIQAFTVADADSGIGENSSIFLRPPTDVFYIDSSGNLAVTGIIDYEVMQTVSLEVVVRNSAPPHFEAIAQVSITVENQDDNPPVATSNILSIEYDEIDRQVRLDVGITITDNDGRGVTNLVRGTVRFESENIEPSFAYSPVTEGQSAPDFNCPLEVGKGLKFPSCGIPDLTILSRHSEGVLRLQGGLEVDVNVLDDSILFNSSQNQYATYFGNVGTLESDGLTISTWVWYEPTSSTQPQALLSKISSSQLLYGIFCIADGSLEFIFTSEGSSQSVVFPHGCSSLEGAWHHLGVVVSNRDSPQWTLGVAIDGSEFGSVDIPQPFDSTGRFVIGATRANFNSPTTNFFNGRVHMLTVSLFSSDLNNLNCVTGCGLVLISLEDSPLTHYYNYSQRTLLVEGTQSIELYEAFLDSLAVVFPFTEPRVSQYILSYTVQDEVFHSIPTFINLEVVPSNDFQPQLSLNGNSGVQYRATSDEGSSPVAVLNTTSFFLTDMDFIEFEYVVTARIVNALQPSTEEILTVSNIPNGMNVSYSTDHTLTITGLFPLPVFEAVVRTLSYENTADDPVTSVPREIVVTLSDPPFPPVSEQSSIQVSSVDDPPSLAVVLTQREYSEGDGAVPIFESVSVTDPDDDLLFSATVTFTPLDPGMEFLSANTSGTDVTAAYDPSSGTLTLTGADTKDNYAAVLLSVTYEHTGMEAPSLGSRVFSVVVSAEHASSVPRTVTLFFAAVNDAPVINLSGRAVPTHTVNFVEDTDEVISIVSPNATITDVDSDTLSHVFITIFENEEYESISVTIPENSDIRAFHDTPDIVELIPAHGTSAPLSSFEAVLRTVMYHNTAEEPVPGVRTVQFVASDGEDVSTPALSEVNVIAVNDPPSLDLDTETLGTGYVTDSFEEGGEPVFITARSINLSDNDVSDVVTMAMITIQLAVDGLDERIVSTNPNVSLPLPTNGQSVTYVITGHLLRDDVISLLTSLQYHNTRIEPTPGERVISVVVSDGTLVSNTAIVSLTVVGVNENTPQFTMSSYSFMVNESLPSPASVGIVTAVDIDDGRDGDVNYEILASDPLEGLAHFTIDETSGQISTAVELNWESIRAYDLTILATDSGLPQRAANVSVIIRVVDINDNPPVFYPDGDNVEIFVLETREVGFVVETVPITDPDGGNDVISLVLNNGEVPFAVHVISHTITVDGDLDVDSQSAEGCESNVTYDLQLVATDFNPPHPSSTAVVLVTVVDVNDNEPQFVSDTSFTVVENNDLPYLFTVNAVDRDCTSNGELTYSFNDSIVYSLFNINGSTGDISSLVPLDREEREYHTFTVLATDNGAPRHTNSVEVTIQVLDTNDNAPVFGEEGLEFEVSEDDESAVLSGVVATDIDARENGMVATYHLEPTSVPLHPITQEPFFNINQQNGDIYFSANDVSPVFEFEPYYTLIVYAVDAGTPPLTGSTEVIVRVIDINDNAPVISTTLPQGEVPENEPAGYLVAVFTATNADSGEFGEVVFSLIGHENDFLIDPTTGDLTTARPLDFESECYFSLSVVASDSGPNPLHSQPLLFEVFVQPLEDNPPVFPAGDQSVAVSIPENSPPGTPVIQVTAVDSDSSDCYLGDATSGSGSRESELIYSFNRSSDSFSINEVTGEIQLLTPLDYEEIQRHTLTVVATDAGGFMAYQAVIVSVLDRNDHAPQFRQPFYEGIVSENAAVGSSVLQVSATDEDSLDQGRLTYSLSEHSPYFNVGSTDGIVYVSGQLDFESPDGNIMILSIEVTDSAGNSAAVNVTITIVDSNDIPPVINTQPRTLIFMEGQVSLRPFPLISISDSDSSQHLCSASVQLQSSAETAVDQPEQCSCTDTTSAATCTPGCMEFLQLHPDLFPGTVRQLQEGFALELTGNYSIDEYKNALERIEYVNVIFDPEPLVRTISVSVFDCQLPSNTLVQSIDIQPLNLIAPSLDLNGDNPGINYQTSFTERGDAVAIVSANLTISDEDMVGMEQVLTGSDIRLTNPQNEEEESIFITSNPHILISASENSTHITLTGVATLEEYAHILQSVHYNNLAREPNPAQRVIEFIAHEYSLSSPPAYTVVTIATINDFPPTVLANPPQVNYVIAFEEESAGVLIVSSTAVIVDEDSTNDNVTEMIVYVINPSPTERLFLTESETTISPSITFETQSQSTLSFTGSAPPSYYEDILKNIQYQNMAGEFTSIFPPTIVFIQIADHSLSGFTVVQVQLSPVNDHSPQFAEDSVTISVPENVTVGTTIYQVEYMDSDTFSPSEVNFSIVGGSSFFAISRSTGVITLMESLDHETASLHAFTIEVTDGLMIPDPTTSTAVITVIVTDQNDHVPMFTQELYNATIAEGAPIGTSVLQLSANDRDSEIHSRLEFAVINTTAFIVDSTGTLYTAVDLDQEDEPLYQFVVSVRNPGDVAADLADVFIAVSDVNDHPPSISQPPDAATLQEPLTRTHLFPSLTITDSDTNPSLDYAIVQLLGNAPGVLLATSSLPGITVTGNGSNSIIFLGESRSLSDYEQVLRGVVYEDTAEEPLPISREIAYQVGSEPGTMITLDFSPSLITSNVTLLQVLVELVNDQVPVIVLDTRSSNNPVSSGCPVEGVTFATSYTEDGNPVPLSDSSLNISDADSGDTTISWATVEILLPRDEDSLRYSGPVPVNVSASTSTRLVIQGPASIAQFEAALRSVAYESVSQLPSGNTLVQFTVNDGHFTSDPTLACVQLSEVNDAPVLTLGAGGEVDTLVMYSEGQSEGLVVAPLLEITGKTTHNTAYNCINWGNNIVQLPLPHPFISLQM